MSKDFIIASGIFAFALIIRLIYLFQISHAPTFYVPIIDSHEYHQMASRVITDGVMGEPFFWQSFYYPFFLSRLYYFTGSSILAAKLFCMILGSLTCALVYYLGKMLFSRTTGVIAALILTFYGPVIFFEAELLATGWACFFSVMVVLLLLKAAKPDSGWPLYLFSGLCAGLAVITRASFVPFVIASGLWLLWKTWRLTPSHHNAFAKALLFVGSTIIIPILVGLLALLETGTFRIMPESGPINLYIGNNPEAEQTVMLRPGSQWQQIIAMPRKHGIEDRADHPAFYMNQFLNYVRTEPGDYLNGLLHKSVQFTSSREIPRNIDIYLNRGHSSLLSILIFKIGRFGFPFGLLFPLAIVGLVLNIKRIPIQIILLPVLYGLSIILVFVSARYRIPVIPVLALLAALGFQNILESLRAKRLAGTFLLVLVIVVIAAASSIAGPFAPEKYNFEAEMHYCLGYYMWDNDMLDKAYEHLTKAVELAPDYADAQKILGRTYYKRGQYHLARQHLEKAALLNPQSYSTPYQLGKTLVKLGELQLAIEQFDKAVVLADNVGNIFMAVVAEEQAEKCREQISSQH